MIKIAVKLPAFVFPMRKSKREGGRFQTPPSLQNSNLFKLQTKKTVRPLPLRENFRMIGACSLSTENKIIPQNPL